MDEVVEALEKYQGLVPLVYDIETMSLDEARPQEMYYAVYLKREADKVITRHKYKRCLAMYRYCAIKALYALDCKGDDVEWKWYSKWMHKWYKLSEKFKPNKEVSDGRKYV